MQSKNEVDFGDVVIYDDGIRPPWLAIVIGEMIYSESNGKLQGNVFCLADWRSMGMPCNRGWFKVIGSAVDEALLLRSRYEDKFRGSFKELSSNES